MSDRGFHGSRRDFLALGGGALVIAAIPFAARQRREVVRRTLPLMGTIAELAVVHENRTRAEAALDAAFDELARIERLMTRFAPTSDVGRVNLAAAGIAVPVSSETAGVVLAALNWAVVSDGAFDPAIERVSSLWNVLERVTPPPRAAVERLASRNLYRSLELAVHRGQPVIVRRDTDVGLDLGAIAKGYAVDHAGEVLRAHGMHDAIVKVGGDLVALGAPPEGGAWRVGIRSPASESVMIGEVDVSDGAVATSGDYQRYFMYHGVRYHHLMDPVTAAPRRTEMHSITVRAATCMHADAAATACFGMDEARAQLLLAAKPSGPKIVRIA